jgi:hypothetical protein
VANSVWMSPRMVRLLRKVVVDMSAGGAVRPGRQSRFVAQRDEAAHRDAGKGVQPREDGVPDVPADVLEVDVDPVRGRCGHVQPRQTAWTSGRSRLLSTAV